MRNSKKRTKEEKRERRQKHRKVRRVVWFCILAFFVCAIAVGVHRFYPVYREYKASMYDIISNMDEGTFRRATNTVIYDKDDAQIAKIGYEKYTYVPITEISDYIQNGYIAQEDKNFKTHHGVDWGAVFRAGFQYIRHGGKITQGGSTITQQVIKNNLLTSERTFSRKMMEMMIARQLEKEYTKAQIMEFYTNSIYFGEGCYGVEGASQYYFGKSAAGVDLAEAAMLVGTSNLPNKYNPVADYEACMKKKSDVLDHMLQQGYITKEEHDQADAERPEIVKKTDNGTPESSLSTYAIHCAVLKMMEHDGFQFQYTFAGDDEYQSYLASYQEAYSDAENTIRSGGYEIHTSLDQGLCQQLQNSVNNTLAGETSVTDDGRYDLQAGAVSIDNNTGMVVAVVGSRNDGDSYNRSYQAVRQSGSAIKPLLDYGPAVNEGFETPGSTVTDQALDINGYKPKNAYSGYRGNMPLREGLARSVNTIAVQLFQETGAQSALSYLGNLKFSTLSFADQNNAAVSLGGFTNGVTVEDMARGYATIENGGQMRDSTCIRSLVSEKNGEIYNHDQAETKQVFLNDTAFMLEDMMQGVFREEYGTAHKYENESQIYAGKTGTTNDKKDAWFAGFSAYYTTVVWTGCDTPKSNDNLVGSGYPASIWTDYMNSVHAGLEKKDFTMPDTISLSNGSSEKAPDYQKSGDIYASRPSGFDYVSGQLKEKAEQAAAQKRIEKEKAAAEKAVSDFESFQITDVEDAENLETNYQNVMTAIGAIEDETQRSDYYNRAAKKYDLLSGDVETNWKEAIAEEKQKEQDEQYIRNQKAADASAKQAVKKVEETREDTVRAYIDALNQVTVSTQAVKNLETAADAALEKCREYASYDELKSQLDAAKAHADALPTSDQIQAMQQSASQDQSAAQAQIAQAG